MDRRFILREDPAFILNWVTLSVESVIDAWFVLHFWVGCVSTNARGAPYSVYTTRKKKKNTADEFLDV